MMQAKQAIAPVFCLKTFTTDLAETCFGRRCGFLFLFNIAGLSSGVTGICRGTWSIVGSILCVGLRQQRQPFFASKSADSCLLWYAVRQRGFLGKQQCNVLTYFGMQIPGHNNHMSWQQPTSDSRESVVSFSRLLDFILHDSWMRALEIIALSAVTPGGDEAVAYLWSWSLRKSEFCCDCSAVCNQEQEEIHSWKVVFPGNEYHSL